MPKFEGKYEMYTFPVQHGSCPNGGLIIKDGEELLLYITDFNVCKWKLSDYKFTRVMVECNYIEEMANDMEDFKVKRQINTHMGLEGLKIFLNTLDLSRCKEVYLLHQSQGLGNPSIMGASIWVHLNKKIPVGVCEQFGGVDWYGRR